MSIKPCDSAKKTGQIALCLHKSPSALGEAYPTHSHQHPTSALHTHRTKSTDSLVDGTIKQSLSRRTYPSEHILEWPKVCCTYQMWPVCIYIYIYVLICMYIHIHMISFVYIYTHIIQIQSKFHRIANPQLAASEQRPHHSTSPLVGRSTYLDPMQPDTTHQATTSHEEQKHQQSESWIMAT